MYGSVLLAIRLTDIIQRRLLKAKYLQAKANESNKSSPLDARRKRPSVGFFDFDKKIKNVESIS